MRGNTFRGVEGCGGAGAHVEELPEPGGLAIVPAAVLWRAWWATGWALLARGAATLRVWIERSPQRLNLYELPDRELDDIGVPRETVRREPRRPLWTD